MAKTIVVCVPDPMGGPGTPPCPTGQIMTTEVVEWPFLDFGEWGLITGGIAMAMITLWLIGLAVKSTAGIMDMGADE